MGRRKLGKRHTLVFYKRSLDRLWHISLPFGVILLLLWWQNSFGTPPLINTSGAALFFAGGVVGLAITVFALFARNLAYVQASTSYIRIVTPLLRVNISYRRIRTVRSANFSNLFPPHQAGWALRNSLSPFYGRTVVVIRLKSFPISPKILKMFIPHQMFSPMEPGLVLIVPDWMAFSTELDSFIASWRHKKTYRKSNIFALSK